MTRCFTSCQWRRSDDPQRLCSLLGNFSILRVDFVLKRHMGYYLLQVYVPSSLLVMLSWVSFFIHREATADRVNIGVMTFLSLTTLSFDIRSYTAAVSYLTALDWFVIMAYVFLFASLLQFAFVHYFTKVSWERRSSHLQVAIFQFGYGESLFNDLLKNDRDANVASALIYSSHQQRTNRRLGLSSDRAEWRRSLEFWFCLSGDMEYKRAMRQRATRFGVNSRSELDVVSCLVFPLSFVLLNVFYWIYFLHLQD